MAGRVVLVTGASSGIGAATARAFGQVHDRVVLAARRVERLQAIVATLCDSLVVSTDLTRPDDIERLATRALDHYGHVDVLVNNAGAGRYDWLEQREPAEILEEMNVNLTAPILLSRALLPAMQARGRGVIINVDSVAGKIGTPTMSVYNATKFGLDGFSEALRRETASQGIAVCVIYPGPVGGTEFGAQKRGPAFRRGAPPWLRTTPERVARAIVGLADRPRRRLIIPWYYGLAVAANTLAPWLVDMVLYQVSGRARRQQSG